MEKYTMVIIWVAAMVAFAIVEASTMQLTSIWFAFGALAGLAAASLGAQLWVQVVCFVVVTAVTLAVTRPLVKRKLDTKKEATNADRLLGSTAVVKERIDNLEAKGCVAAGGVLWTARSENGESIDEGSLVKVLRIEGVKLIVETEKAPVSK